MNECFYAMYKTSLRFAAAWETSETSLLIYFQSHSVPFWLQASRGLEARGQNPRGRGRNPRGRGRGRGHNPRGRGRGRGQVFRPRGRGQASRPNIPGSYWSWCNTLTPWFWFKNVNILNALQSDAETRNDALAETESRIKMAFYLSISKMWRSLLTGIAKRI